MDTVEEKPKCSIIKCEDEAKHHPVLLLMHYSKQGRSITYSKKPAEAVLDIGLCDHHGKHATADQFIDAKGWAAIEATFARTGKAMPTRRMTKLKLVPFVKKEVAP